MNTEPSASPPACAEIRIDLEGCTGKADLLDRFARALRFPHWFGHNWDALSDCLTDLSWLPARGYRLLLSDPRAIRAAAPEALETALEILAEAAAFWSEGGVSFEFTLIENAPESRPPAPDAPPSPR